ncbi:hypothetical protein P4S95_01285 [Aneurinibacillus aneurinilyticus]|uniref:hypothetical protein n=1 Tax=Aneurinibacillus aneurinilyticus TaxID=1391 RepID=UPI002E1A8872|nr:hypothetical protein [Aneurinibacillus aneurinilyticus]
MRNESYCTSGSPNIGLRGRRVFTSSCCNRDIYTSTRGAVAGVIPAAGHFFCCFRASGRRVEFAFYMKLD